MKRIHFIVMVLFAFIVAGAVTSIAWAQDKERAEQDHAERAIIRTEHEIADAYTHNDTNGLSGLFTDDYRQFSAVGESFTIGQRVADIKAGDMKYELFDTTKIKVRFYGNTAIVTGNNHVKARYKGGDTDSNGHYMRVYIKRDDKWQPIVMQRGSGIL